jgi:hypothetical protein
MDKLISKCPSCEATDNNAYVDANSVNMRACGRCMIQWRDLSTSGQTDLAPQLAPQSVKDIWNEEMVFKMTRGTWADLIDGLPIGRCYVMDDGSIRVERKQTTRDLGIEPNVKFRHCPPDETI